MENGGIIGVGLKATDRIYRTVTRERLNELLTSKRNVLVRPKKWADTFEDLLGQSMLRIGPKRQPGIFNTDNIYGQCWTLHKASDAIWQIYSQGTDGFRIRTRVSTLLDSMKSQVEKPDISCYVGRVRYMSDRDLIKFGETHFTHPNASASEVVAAAYLVKRNAFEHEKEVRLVYQALSAGEMGDLFSYSWEPNEVIDQIMVHPLLPVEDYKQIKSEIESMGFRGEIKRSLLYAQPKGFEFQFGPKNS